MYYIFNCLNIDRPPTCKNRKCCDDKLCSHCLPGLKMKSCLLILLSVSLLHLQPCEAKTLPRRSRVPHPPPTLRTVRDVPPLPRQPSASDTVTQGFSVKYTLVTANSADCEPSLVNNFPVRVQYRKTSPRNDRDASGSRTNGGDLDSTILDNWKDSSYAPVLMPG